MNRVLSLILAALFAAPTAALAQEAPLVKQPYEVQIATLLAEHRFLSTELFQDQFPRDLARQTQLALGPLAHVEAAASHPLADTIRRDGLDAALDGHVEVSNRRTWFFLVHYREGQFHLQGRFFDGLTGLCGPPAATATTGDRGRLAHLAARMIAEPFALVGTVTGVKGDSVDLTLHGGELAGGSKVAPGSVFALSRIAVESGKWRARRTPWAALEAKGSPAAGIVASQYWHRFQEDKIASSKDVMYRALLLPTRSAPLKLQVVDFETSQPLGGVVVKIGGGSREIGLVTDAGGMATTTEKIAGLAIVKLLQGGTVRAQFPAPIVDERTVVCAISDQPDGEDFAGLEVRRQLLFARMLETLQVVDQRFGEQRIRLGESLEASRDHAKRTLVFLDREIAEIRGEHETIKEIAAKQKGAKANPEEGEKGLARLAQLRGAVSESIVRHGQLIGDRDRQTEKQKTAVKLVEQGSLFESQAKYDEAIDAYEKAAALLPESNDIGELLKRLRAGWAVKDEGHRQARKFLMETWPKIDPAVIKDHLAGAQKALDVCRDAGDRLTPRRFLLANVDHLASLSKIGEKLKRSNTADDRQRLLALNETKETLRRLSNQASEQSAPPPKVEKK